MLFDILLQLLIWLALTLGLLVIVALWLLAVLFIIAGIQYVREKNKENKENEV